MKKIFLFLMIVFGSFILLGCNDNPNPPGPGPGPDDPVDPPEEKTEYSIEITNPERELYIGDSLNLTAKVYPETVSQEVTWSVKKALAWEINTPAEINGNTLTGLNYGKVYITASSTAIEGLQASIEFEIKHVLLDEKVEPAFNIIGFYGEDAATSYNVHYMNKNLKAYVLLTTADDTEFSKATRYNSEGFFYENLDETNATTWPARNVWDTRITGLTPETSYIYKINNGDDTYSDIYHFTTASNTSTTTSFLYLTDNHYANFTDGSNGQASVSEETIRTALKMNSNISFLLGGGDKIDCGGDRFIWEKYFNFAHDSLTSLPCIDAAGNHELYFNGTGQRDSQFHQIHTAAPLNGSSDCLRSTSWFVFNDCLFIIMNNAKHVTEYNQIKWAANVLETVPHKHSIITFHTPIDFSSWTNMEYIKMFDKYGVDLVLSGHTHSHHYNKNNYNNEVSTDPYLGTTYLTGAYSGVKSTNSADAIHTANGYIIDITETGIHFRRIHPDGVVAAEWDVPYRKTATPVIESDHEKLINSINLAYNTETGMVDINWSEQFFGNVKKITFTEKTFINVSDYSVCTTPSHNKLSLPSFKEGYDYNINCHIDFVDGTTFDKVYELKLTPEINVTSANVLEDYAELIIPNPGENIMLNLDCIKLYLNNKLVQTISSNSLKQENNVISLTDLIENTEYSARVNFIDYYGNVMFTRTVTFKTL